jgi:hypothetical protein
MLSIFKYPVGKREARTGKMPELIGSKEKN